MAWIDPCLSDGPGGIQSMGREALDETDTIAHVQLHRTCRGAEQERRHPYVRCAFVAYGTGSEGRRDERMDLVQRSFLLPGGKETCTRARDAFEIPWP